MQELAIAFRILKRGWWIILLTAILSVSLTSWINSRRGPTYQTDLRLFVSADLSKLEGGNELIYSYSSLDRSSIITTFVEIANSRRIRESAAVIFNQPPEYFNQYTVSTVDLPNSSVLEMVVTGPNPQTAQYFANAVAQSAVDFVRTNYSAYKLEILDSAYLPTVPIEPNIIQDMVVALVLGTILGLLIAVGVDLLPNPMETLQTWTSVNKPTLALKRSYFERHIDDWMYREGVSMNLALINLASPPAFEGSLKAAHLNRLLKEITRIIREEVRGKDIIVRWNRNTIAILMSGVDYYQAAATLEQISRKLSYFLNIDNGDFQPDLIKPIIGGVMVTERLSYPSIVKRVEAALLKASDNGSGWIIFSSDLSIHKELSSLS